MCLYGQEEQHTSTLGHNPFSRFTLVFLITYLAERSAVFAVAVGCRPLPRCSRCGCPAECYDHCHCSSPNLRTGSQDTSITTHVLTEGLRPDAIAKRALLSSRNAHSPHSQFVFFWFRLNCLTERAPVQEPNLSWSLRHTPITRLSHVPIYIFFFFFLPFTSISYLWQSVINKYILLCARLYAVLKS